MLGEDNREPKIFLKSLVLMLLKYLPMVAKIFPYLQKLSGPGKQLMLKDAAIFYVLNQRSRKCLDVKDARTDSGVSIQQWTYDGTLHKKWYLESLYDNYSRLISLSSGLCLEVTKKRNVVQGKPADKSAQKWKIDEFNKGLKITPKDYPDLCLGIEEDSLSNGARVILREWDEDGTAWLCALVDFQSRKGGDS